MDRGVQPTVADPYPFPDEITQYGETSSIAWKRKAC